MNWGGMYWLDGLIMVDDPNYNYPDLNFEYLNETAILMVIYQKIGRYGEEVDLFIIMSMEVIRLEDIYLRMNR